MRGEACTVARVIAAPRITPAHAGRSVSRMPAWPCCKDHPRACGEKLRKTGISSAHPGSPPRMRGEGESKGAAAPAPGITPAHAGRSRSLSSLRLVQRDHPRACGEKFNRIAKPFREQGSPPRMRGEGELDLGNSTHTGITPAHAGRRPADKSHRTGRWDHPRACGEKIALISPFQSDSGSPPRMRGKVYAGDWHIAVAGITPAHAGKRSMRYPMH